MMTLRTIAFCVGLPLAMACGPGPVAFDAEGSTPSGIGFQVQPSLVSRGDTAVLVLTNATDQAVGYNLCGSVLERWNGGRWQPVRKLPENHACAAILYGLAPGESTTWSQPIYDFIGPGDYRFTDQIEWMDDGRRVDVVSNSFAVQE